jgi:hypothetical protein
MRKTLIIAAVVTLGIIGCKENKKVNPEKIQITNEPQKIEGTSGETKKPNDAWINDIVLNNNIKWNANKETTEGVMTMLSLINEDKKWNTIEYKKLGDRLNEVKNTVVKECTMKGASHDNLHVWLLPLIEKIEMLQNVESTNEGAYLTNNIKNHLERYYDYFN